MRPVNLFEPNMNGPLSTGSASRCDYALINWGMRRMATIARRFTIICLIFVIFAMLMAAAVANSDRDSRAWRGGLIDTCAFQATTQCRFNQQS
ncbi:hypothetical protein HPDFL43_12368 [Hoeflea phototrophica DFL-43]|uniref:Uncharacterized protein n=2 Tax=Hoeflea TaxID=274591 RepID=A9DHJ7_HOEPD|nr:hypothetical protein HPDFL43_12368 [Hoeflea phototrophica DFL-43]